MREPRGIKATRSMQDANPASVTKYRLPGSKSALRDAFPPEYFAEDYDERMEFDTHAEARGER